LKILFTTLLTTLFFANPAQASYLKSCEYDILVNELIAAPTLNDQVTKYTVLARVEILDAINRGSHVPSSCASDIGSEKLLVLKDGLRVNEGAELKIEYFHVNNFGPTGVVFSERWIIINDEEFGPEHCNDGLPGWIRGIGLSRDMAAPCGTSSRGFCEQPGYEYVSGTGWCQPAGR